MSIGYLYFIFLFMGLVSTFKTVAQYDFWSGVFLTVFWILLSFFLFFFGSLFVDELKED